MNAPLLSPPLQEAAPVRKAPALMKPPPRLWRELSESAKTQLASTIAAMVKRRASGSCEEQSDVDDHDRS
jgi:hypothetical protein